MTKRTHEEIDDGGNKYFEAAMKAARALGNIDFSDEAKRAAADVQKTLREDGVIAAPTNALRIGTSHSETFAVDGPKVHATIINSKSGETVSVLGSDSLESDFALSVALSPDTSVAAVGYGNGVRLWKIASGEMLHELDAENHVDCIEFGRDGQRVFAGSHDGCVRVWSTRTGKLRHELFDRDYPVTCIAVLPDGKKVLAGFEDGSVMSARVHGDATVTFEQRVCTGDRVTGLIAFPDGTTYAGTHANGTLFIWTRHSFYKRTFQLGITSLSVSSDGAILCLTGPDGAWLVETSMWDCEPIHIGMLRHALSAKFVHGTQNLIVLYSEGVIRVYNDVLSC